MNSRHFFARGAAIRAAAMGATLAVLGSILIFSPAPAHAANCTTTGTYGDDVLEGTAGNDVICGSGGNDTINGLGGDDILRGDNGNAFGRERIVDVHGSAL